MSPPDPHRSESHNARMRPIHLRVGRPEAAEIQERMHELRCGMSIEAARVTEQAKQAAEWRYYVRRFPFACVGLAALAGYFIVPGKKQVVRPSEEQLQRLARDGELRLQAAPKTAQKRSAAGTALALLGTVAARAAMAYVGQRIGSHGSTETKSAPAGEAWN